MTAPEPSAATVAWCEVLSAALVAVGLFTILVGALHDFRVTLMVGGGIVEIYWSQRLRRRTHAKTSEHEYDPMPPQEQGEHPPCRVCGRPFSEHAKASEQGESRG